MSGEDIMGIIIFITIALLLFCTFVLTLGEIGILVFITVFVVSVIIAYYDDKEPQEETNDYFTDEDFIHCKIGEWVSRP